MSRDGRARHEGHGRGESAACVRLARLLTDHTSEEKRTTMLMQYLTPEKRMGYRHGDYIMYDDRPTEEQQLKMLEYAKRWGDPVGTCIVCGRVTTGRKKYCSQRCCNDAYMERRRQRHIVSLQKKCVVCGKSFTAKRADTRYCSPACKQSAYRKRVTDNRCAKFGPTDNSNVTDIGSAEISPTDNGNAHGR